MPAHKDDVHSTRNYLNPVVFEGIFEVAQSKNLPSCPTRDCERPELRVGEKRGTRVKSESVALSPSFLHPRVLCPRVEMESTSSSGPVSHVNVEPSQVCLRMRLQAAPTAPTTMSFLLPSSPFVVEKEVILLSSPAQPSLPLSPFLLPLMTQPKVQYSGDRSGEGGRRAAGREGP